MLKKWKHHVYVEIAWYVNLLGKMTPNNSSDLALEV